MTQEHTNAAAGFRCLNRHLGCLDPLGCRERGGCDEAPVAAQSKKTNASQLVGPKRPDETQDAFLVRVIRTEELQKIALQIEARLLEHNDPYDEGEEQYVAGLRDALTFINRAIP